MAELNRSDLPAPHPDVMFLRRLKAKESITVQVLSRRVFGCWVHWNGKSTDPCMRIKSQCEGCRNGRPRRWRGFLHVYNSHNRKQEMLELTEAAVRQLYDQVSDKDDLRGERFILNRLSGDAARVRLTVLVHVVTEEHLPQEKSPLPVLCSLWGQVVEDREQEDQPPLQFPGTAVS